MSILMNYKIYHLYVWKLVHFGANDTPHFKPCLNFRNMMILGTNEASVVGVSIGIEIISKN